MKGVVAFTALVTLASAQVIFPGADESELPTGAEESSAKGRNSTDVDAQVMAALSTLERNFFSLQPTNENSCSLPDGSIGNCIMFSQCSSYSHLVSVINSPSILNFLRTRICRILTNSVQICCPVGNEPRVTTFNAINQPTRQPPQTTLKPFTFPQVPSGPKNPIFPSDCGHSFVDRVVLGTEIKAGMYPWLVALGIPSFGVFSANCGGTLITHKHVLTAAHCFASKSFKPTHARVGEHDLTSDNDGANPQTYRISRSILDDYDIETGQKDIALLILEKDVTFNSKVQPICLPFPPDLRNNNFVGKHLDVVGWGRTNHTIRETSPVPLEAKVEVVTLDRCDKAYRSLQAKLFISERQLCAGTGGADSCNGDSGGPLHYLDQQTGRYYLAGVTSLGVECGRPDFPGVYTRVGSYLNWIETNVN